MLGDKGKHPRRIIMKKRLIVVLAVLATVVGMAFAGTRYIRYSCGCTEAIGSCSGKDKYDDVDHKCPDCQKKDNDKKWCSDIYGKVNQETYDSLCPTPTN